MFIKDEMWYEDLERAKLIHPFLDYEEEEAYSRLVEKGEVGRTWKR